jgi:hypothetical protein
MRSPPLSGYPQFGLLPAVGYDRPLLNPLLGDADRVNTLPAALNGRPRIRPGRTNVQDRCRFEHPG